MANQRSTFGKRNREMKLKDRQREKADRLAARRAENKDAKGPQIAWDEAGGVGSIPHSTETTAPTPPPSDSDNAPTTPSTKPSTPSTTKPSTSSTTPAAIQKPNR